MSPKLTISVCSLKGTVEKMEDNPVWENIFTIQLSYKGCIQIIVKNSFNSTIRRQAIFLNGKNS